MLFNAQHQHLLNEFPRKDVSFVCKVIYGTLGINFIAARQNSNHLHICEYTHSFICFHSVNFCFVLLRIILNVECLEWLKMCLHFISFHSIPFHALLAFNHMFRINAHLNCNMDITAAVCAHHISL